MRYSGSGYRQNLVLWIVNSRGKSPRIALVRVDRLRMLIVSIWQGMMMEDDSEKKQVLAATSTDSSAV